MPEVRVRCGVPVASDFAGRKGTPIVVNEETGDLYVMKLDRSITKAGGSGGQPGPAGPQGPEGPMGTQGPAGSNGAQGPKGDTGEAGPAGQQGPQGLPGTPGAPGVKGDPGDVGQQGPQGLTGDVGPQGLKGDKGDKGDQGIQGIQGPPGTPFMFEGSLAANAATGANVTPISLTGLVFTFEANSRYWVEFQGAVQAPAATTGSGFQLDTSVAVTRVGLNFFHQLANTGTVTGGSSIADDTSVGVSTGRPTLGVDTPTTGSAYLITGASGGTAQLRYRSEVAAVSTVMAGFMMRVRKLP